MKIMGRLERPVDRFGSAIGGAPSRFCERVAKLLDRVDYQRADGGEEREAIFALRYQAYLRDGTLTSNTRQTYNDQYDDTDNAYLFGVHVDGELASAIRIHVGSQKQSYFPTLEFFPEYLQPVLDAGQTVIDTTCFVTDARLSQVYRELPYVALRLCGMAARFFGAHQLLTAVRPEHQVFYQRALQQQVVCPSRAHPRLARPISLMANDYAKVVEHIHRRYPFFVSTAFERRMLFE
jgi:N-acyl amino acid synthase FeeM